MHRVSGASADPARRWCAGLAVLAALALAGCGVMADRPDPAGQLATAEAAVAQAELIAGRASPEVRIAREKLSRARRAVEAEDGILAQRAAEQAEADAKLAIARFEAARARAASDAIASKPPPAAR